MIELNLLPSKGECNGAKYELKYRTWYKEGVRFGRAAVWTEGDTIFLAKMLSKSLGGDDIKDGAKIVNEPWQRLRSRLLARLK